MTAKKILIAYYSYSGNTKNVAKIIQEETSGTLFEIEPKEKAEKVIPELKNQVDVSNYDIIFIGTPVWWYTFATPIRTFLSNNDFKGKTIVPFCTHGGGGASNTYKDMEEICRGAEFKKGFTSYGNTATKQEIESWLKTVL